MNSFSENIFQLVNWYTDEKLVFFWQNFPEKIAFNYVKGQHFRQTQFFNCQEAQFKRKLIWADRRYSKFIDLTNRLKQLSVLKIVGFDKKVPDYQIKILLFRENLVYRAVNEAFVILPKERVLRIPLFIRENTFFFEFINLVYMTENEAFRKTELSKN